MFDRRLRATVGVLTLALCVSTTGAGAMAAQQPPPDNSKVNQRDQKPAQMTADDQSNKKSDVQITADIRKAVMADSTLSTYAHNVKIITKNGKVTLKGPVRSAEEKTTVAAKATEVAGATNVTNQISIAPAKAGEKKKAGA